MSDELFMAKVNVSLRGGSGGAHGAAFRAPRLPYFRGSARLGAARAQHAAGSAVTRPVKALLLQTSF